MLMNPPNARNPTLELVADLPRQLPPTYQAPDAKALKKLPDLQKEATLARLAEEINNAHGEIECRSQEFVQSGIETVKRAVVCGTWLRTVKAGVGHGNFKNWCEQNLNFKLRKAQYYMLLAERDEASDILKLKPQSLRQALIYAGALPEDGEKAHAPDNLDELAQVRKAAARLLLQLKANEDHYAEELLRATEPLIEWRTQLATRGSQREKSAVVVDIEAKVESDVEANTHHDAFLKAQQNSHALGGEGKLREASEKHPSPVKDVLGAQSRENSGTLGVETPMVIGEADNRAKDLPAARTGSKLKKWISQQGKTRAQTREFWIRQDWEKRDSVLARQIGCSRAIVGRWRKKLGKPSSPLKHASPGSMRVLTDSKTTRRLRGNSG